MKEVSIQVSYDVEEITVGIGCLDRLYDWLSDSPIGLDEDLVGLNMAIDILGRVQFQLKGQDDG